MKTTIVTLATLHQFHLKSKFYSLSHLRTIIEKANPDVICVELTAADLRCKEDWTAKSEYSKCIIPLSEKKGYNLVPMEPNEPKYSRIVNMHEQMLKKTESEEPKKIEIFNQYTEILYDYLFTYWGSPTDVNSSLTNTLFELKHAFQNSLFGPIEKQCWEEWNTHFLNTILETAEEYEGKRILVTVGVEHVYWLKKHLKNNSRVRLVEVNEVFNE
ncbi:hypothetical protein KAW65_02715 [candidate division WOR-3 bacterium]|nr:hypothetical protein [candidate division WOR-3 bacterium]